jgi:hypothetical protein
MDLASASTPVAKPGGPRKALKPPQRRELRGTAARPQNQQAARADRCGDPRISRTIAGGWVG